MKQKIERLEAHLHASMRTFAKYLISAVVSLLWLGTIGALAVTFWMLMEGQGEAPQVPPTAGMVWIPVIMYVLLPVLLGCEVLLLVLYKWGYGETCYRNIIAAILGPMGVWLLYPIVWLCSRGILRAGYLQSNFTEGYELSHWFLLECTLLLHALPFGALIVGMIRNS